MIEVVDDMDSGRPLPALDQVSAAFFPAAARGTFLLQRSPARTCQFYPRPHSLDCSGEPEWLEASGLGRVHTSTVVPQMGIEPFAGMLPYVVAIIDLDEGPRVMGNVTDIPVDDVAVGMRVQFYIRRISEDVGIPFWRPLARPGRMGTQVVHLLRRPALPLEHSDGRAVYATTAGGLKL